MNYTLKAFPSDRMKVAYVISYLSGRVKALALFIDTFKQIFQSATPGREAAKALVALRQGNC